MTSARSPISILYLSILYLSTCIAVAETASATSVATFDDLGLGVEDEYHGEDSAGGFDSGGAYFVNNFDTLYGSWDGFAASTTTDTTTGAWSNQYSAITGGGEGGSAAYGVGYWSAYALSNPTIEFATERSVLGSYVTNTTYTYSSMLNGDSFAKQFGGESGDDPDWFLLSIFGYDTSGELTSSIDFYLADYRFGDNSQDYLVDDWE